MDRTLHVMTVIRGRPGAADAIERRAGGFASSALAVLLLALALGTVRVEATPPSTPFTASGRVFDALSGEALADANVVRGDGAGVATDRLGRFELEVAAGDSITVSHIGYRAVTLRPSSGPLTVRLEPRALAVPQVRVTGGLVAAALDDVPASVTVLQAAEIASSGGLHLQDLVQSVPNLNWAGSTSRPRYFQVRGIGERSHYAGAGPPNFSVGLVMDDVDLSGMGTAAMLHDVEQLEVFKGPQSSSFGPNAMAGLINMQSTAPVRTPLQALSVSAGNDDMLRYNGSINFPLSEEVAARLSFHDARADGFRDNAFLGRDDTNRRRETFARAKVLYAAADGTSWTATLFRAHADNRFDAWAADNNEDLVTYSDNPGQDRQLTKAGSLRGERPLASLGVRLTTITSYSDTDLEHSYDGDWGNDEYWSGDPFGFDPEVEGYRYDFFDRIRRERRTLTQEVRLLKSGLRQGGDELIVGVYLKDLRESDDAAGYLFGGDATDLDSRFDLDDAALYGQYGLDFSETLRASANLRVDRHAISYTGVTDAGTAPVAFDVIDWLAGGRLALQYDLDPHRTLYASASQGYRPGGVNQHPRLAAHNRPYDPEYAVNFELGLRSSTRRSTSSLTLFHTRRRVQQVSLSSQQEAGDPNSFVYFIANASRGRNSGIEWEQTYRPVARLRLFGSLALLATHVEAYTFQTASGASLTRGDRAAAHAPAHTLRVGGEYRSRHGLSGRLEMTATDDFYFSDGHDQRSEAYRLLHGALGYEWRQWTVNLWGRNLLDERYAVRGFYFGLEPPNFEDTLYKSYGDPRQFGVTLSARFDGE